MASALAAIILRIGVEEKITIDVDGSVYRFHPSYPIKELIPENYKFKFELYRKMKVEVVQLASSK